MWYTNTHTHVVVSVKVADGIRGEGIQYPPLASVLTANHMLCCNLDTSRQRAASGPCQRRVGHRAKRYLRRDLHGDLLHVFCYGSPSTAQSCVRFPSPSDDGSPLMSTATDSLSLSHTHTHRPGVTADMTPHGGPPCHVLPSDEWRCVCEESDWFPRGCRCGDPAWLRMHESPSMNKVSPYR